VGQNNILTPYFFFIANLSIKAVTYWYCLSTETVESILQQLSLVIPSCYQHASLLCIFEILIGHADSIIFVLDIEVKAMRRACLKGDNQVGIIYLVEFCHSYCTCLQLISKTYVREFSLTVPSYFLLNEIIKLE
jgi:hypothetical protein